MIPLSLCLLLAAAACDCVVVADNHTNSSTNSSSSSSGIFVWITDAHFDPFYSTANAQIHFAGAPCNLSDQSPKFSAYGCGSSAALVDSAVSNAAKAVADLGYEAPDFILYTGDSTRHDTGGLPMSVQDVVESAIEYVSSLFPMHFPGVPLVRLPSPDLGNNDMLGDYFLNVTSTQPCLPDNVTGQMPTATNEWLQRVAELNRNAFASELEAATFACGGYMSRMVLDGLVILSLNTLLWSLYLQPPLEDPLTAYDPLGQHEWLQVQLKTARQNKDKVYITGHIPPALMSYLPAIGEDVWQSNHLNRYMETITEYQDVVAAQLFGHVHSNELRALNTFPGDAPPLMTLGSISPCYSNNPFFAIVFFDRNGTTKYPTDLVSYELDLATHNGTIADDPDSNSTIIWSRAFETTATHYLGMAALTNYETVLLSKRMMQDNATFHAYYDHWFMGVEHKQTDCASALCHKQQACLLACGFWNESWQACVDNYNFNNNDNDSSNFTNLMWCPIGGGTVPVPTTTTTASASSNGVFTTTIVALLVALGAGFFLYSCRQRQRERESWGGVPFLHLNGDSLWYFSTALWSDAEVEPAPPPAAPAPLSTASSLSSSSSPQKDEQVATVVRSCGTTTSYLEMQQIDSTSCSVLT